MQDITNAIEKRSKELSETVKELRKWRKTSDKLEITMEFLTLAGKELFEARARVNAAQLLVLRAIESIGS